MSVPSIHDAGYVAITDDRFMDDAWLIDHTPNCSGCGRAFEPQARRLVTRMQSGRHTGVWHRRCQRQHRYELSGSQQDRK